MNRQPATRRLSTGTLFFKKGLPVVLLLAAVAIVVAAMLTGRESALQYVPILGIVGVMYVFYRVIAAGLVDEVLDGGDALIVRNNGLEERVPLSEIAEVKESLWRHGPPRVELLLETPGPLGRVIAFIPSSYSPLPIARSRVFHELSARVQRAHQELGTARSRPTPT